MSLLATIASGSSSLNEARLRSERIRILVLLILFAVLSILAVIRLIVPNPWQGDAPQLALIVLLIMVALEAGMLRQVRCAIARGRTVPRVLWFAMAVIESALPAAILLIIIDFSALSPYLMLLSPFTFVFFLVTILSTLHLDPQLSRASGVIGGLSYAGLLIHVLVEHSHDAADLEFVHPQPMYWFAAFLIVVGGFLAAFVARQLRIHVEAALHEQEMRQAKERMEHDLEIARGIQQGLLPKHPPEIRDFSIAGWSRPADQTGGDYYDWILLENGQFVFSLADVTGHGIGPAIVTAVCRAYARASVGADHELHAVITRINTMLHEDTPADRFITFVLGWLTPDEYTLNMLSAGHGPILMYESATHSVRHIRAQGIPLGMLPDYEFEQPLRITVEPGDALILVSDGFFEWAIEGGEQYGVERLELAILESAHLGPAEIIEHLESSVSGFVGSTPQPDDMTAVILQRHRS